MKQQTNRQRDRLESHVFICTTDRKSEYTCCADAQGDEVFSAVLSWLQKRDVLWSPVLVAKTGCLGLCSAEGAAVAIQPRNQWYSDVQPEDIPELLSAQFGPDATQLSPRPADKPLADKVDSLES